MKTTTLLTLMSLSVATLSAAPPATAASISPGCQEINSNAALDGRYWDLSTLQGSFFDFSVFPMFQGETIIVTAADPAPASMSVLYLTIYESFFTRDAIRGDSPGTIRYTLNQNLDSTPWVMDWGVADPAPGHPSGTAQFTVECIPVDSTASPPPQMQQIGRHTDESCNDVDHSVLEWASGVAGGWSPSWAQWPNEGRGGFVCTRMIAYHRGQWLAIT